MVRGIDKFREFFTGYEGNYVIIGGTACEMHEEIYAQTPRATKDIDIILIVEALSSDFAAKFWEFVKTAGYRQRNKGTGNGECRHEQWRTSGQQTYRQAQERCIPAGCHACSCRHLRSS